MAEHPNFTGLATLSFSQPEKHARRLLGTKEFDTDASICSFCWCQQARQNIYEILFSLWFPHWICRFRLAFEPPCQMVMQKHKGGRKEEWKTSLCGRRLRWVKISAFSNLEVLSTGSSWSCTGGVEADCKVTSLFGLAVWDLALHLWEHRSTDDSTALGNGWGEKGVMLEHIIGRKKPDVPGDLHWGFH